MDVAAVAVYLKSLAATGELPQETLGEHERAFYGAKTEGLLATPNAELPQRRP